jgi:hypothetical protein
LVEQFGESQAVAPELHRAFDFGGADRGMMNTWQGLPLPWFVKVFGRPGPP